MGWIVWTVFFVILFWVGVASFVFGRQGMKHARIEGAAQAEPNSLPSFSFFRTAGAITMAVTAFVWVLVTAFVSFHTVGQREVAIVYNFSGTITGKKDAGVVTTYPWQHIKKENIGIQHDEWTLRHEQRRGLDRPAEDHRHDLRQLPDRPGEGRRSLQAGRSGVEDDHHRRQGAAGVQGDDGHLHDAAS